MVGDVEDEFMPYSCTELNKALQDYARIHLNETEETKRKALEEVKEFARKEFNVQTDDSDDIKYLCFLRSRKFDVKRTCSLMKRGFEFIENHRYMFDRVDSESVRRTIQSKIIGFLPYRDAKGRAIIYIRSECWNPNELKAGDVIFGSIVALHIAAENPVNQVAGFVVILDFKNLTVQQVVGMSSWVFFGLQALQRCCPCLVKEFHVVHTPAIFRATWRMVKPLISEKITKRITFYRSSHWNSLHHRISPRILPEELGGELGPFSYEHWASDIAAIEKKYHQNCSLVIKRPRKEEPV